MLLALLLAACVAPAAPIPAAIDAPGPVPPLAPDIAPSLYDGLGVADLAARSYGAGDLRAVEPLGANDAFTRTLVA